MSSLAAVFDAGGITNRDQLNESLDGTLVGCPGLRVARHSTPNLLITNALKHFAYAVEQPFVRGSSTLFIDGSFFDDRPPNELVDILFAADPKVLRTLNGQFNAIISHPERNQLVVITDRLGTRPLYYGNHRGRHAVCSQIRAVHTALSRPPELSPIGVLELFAFAHNIEDRTVFNGVTVLPPGSLITIDADRLAIIKYEEVQYSPDETIISAGEWGERISSCIASIIPRYLRGPARKGLFLSGGLDSRIIAGAIGHVGGKVNAYTFGDRESRDVCFARELARILEFPHHTYEYDKNFLSRSISDVVSRTECSAPFYHATSVLFHDEISKETDAIIVGFCGDALSGGHLNRKILKSNGGADIQTQLFKRALRAEVSDLSVIFQKAFFEEYWPQTIEAFYASIEAIDEPNAFDLADVWDIRHRQRRFTFSATKVDRERFEVFAPLLDRDFVDLMTSMPVEARWQQLAYRNAIVDGFPALQKVKWAKTGRSVPRGRRQFWFDESFRVALKISRVAARKLMPNRPYPVDTYRDIAQQFRDDDYLIPNDLPDYLSNGSLSDTVFDVDGIRRIAYRHLAGEDFSHVLGSILTLGNYYKTNVIFS